MTQPAPPDIEKVRSAMAAAFRDNWKSYCLQGVLLFILGILAVATPLFATLAIEILLGWLILFGGLIGCYRAFRDRGESSFWPPFLAGAVSIIVGVLLLVYPLQGVLTLTILVAAFLFAEGLMQIMMSISLRPAKQWVWLLVSGLLALVLAVMVIAQLPGSAGWLLGLLVGINLMFFGSSLALTAYSFRDGGEKT